MLLGPKPSGRLLLTQQMMPLLGDRERSSLSGTWICIHGEEKSTPLGLGEVFKGHPTFYAEKIPLLSVIPLIFYPFSLKYTS